MNIDGHKLHLHPQRVTDWLKGERIAPLYVEISPTNACNHNCSFCGLDFAREGKRHTLDMDRVELALDLQSTGVKSVMIGGEGEPCLAEGTNRFAKQAAGMGIDVALTTNGTKFDPECLKYLKWVKFSINAGTRETYAKVHGRDDFRRVMDNLGHAVNYQCANELGCSIGVQLVALPDNVLEISHFAEVLQGKGVDYFVVKQYSQHPQSINQGKPVEALIKHRDIGGMPVIQREPPPPRTYSKCLAEAFWSYIDSQGNVWGCSCFQGDERFLYGNIYERSFKEIWENRVFPDVDVSKCRIGCRMDACNRYLHELTHPDGHVNFI